MDPVKIPEGRNGSEEGRGVQPVCAKHLSGLWPARWEKTPTLFCWICTRLFVAPSLTIHERGLLLLIVSTEEAETETRAEDDAQPQCPSTALPMTWGKMPSSCL